MSKFVYADKGTYGRVAVNTEFGIRQFIALQFDKNPDTTYVFLDKHARKIGLYLLSQGIINPIRNYIKK